MTVLSRAWWRQRFLPVALASQLLPSARLGAQSYRVTVRLEWAADSSWQGVYYQKPYDFRIREELEGRLVFDIVDSAFAAEKASGAAVTAARTARAIRLADDGAASGAVLIEAVGSSSYTADVRKGSGDCAPPDPRDTTGQADVPYVVREEARGAWDVHAPGKALIVLRGAEPVGIAFSPKPMPMQSVRRLLCPQPETATRWDAYRITAQAGELVRRTRPDSLADPGRWTIATSRTARGGYTTSAKYSAVVTQHRAAPDDPSGSTGRLQVTKTLVFTWEREERVLPRP